MNKLRQYRPNSFLFALAMVCTTAPVCAQERVPSPGGPPIVVGRKQAEALSLAQLPPEYPPIAKVNYLAGLVQVELTVNSKGKVASAHVLEGIAILAESALKATRRWVYSPLATPSGPSGFVTTVKLKFNLKTRGIMLAPQQAERDFLRQVKPAQIVRRPEDAHPGDAIHARLLVNDQGQVVDMDVSPADRGQLEAARETLRGWTFRPAYWGSLPIASYVEVDVPVSASTATRVAAYPVNP